MIFECSYIWVGTVMNGIEACHVLRARGVCVPILALTGNALAEDRAKFINAGASVVLSKPINRRQLHKAILELIQYSGTRHVTQHQLDSE